MNRLEINFEGRRLHVGPVEYRPSLPLALRAKGAEEPPGLPFRPGSSGSSPKVNKSIFIGEFIVQRRLYETLQFYFNYNYFKYLNAIELVFISSTTSSASLLVTESLSSTLACASERRIMLQNRRAVNI
jgi:hypothetical protein